MNRIYLKVPFVEKDSAKSLGASWDGTKKQWFVTENLDIQLFNRWLDETLTIDSEDNVGDMKSDNSKVENTGLLDLGCDKGISLFEYLKPIQNAVQSAWSQAQWVHAEIENIKKAANGHYYLDLVDYADSDTVSPKMRPIAKMKAIIWATQSTSILNKFGQQTGQTLSKNHKVLLKLHADMHALYGISVTILDIDPAYTLGAMALKLKKIREQLKHEGLYNKQSLMTLPSDFFRIAVISPNNAQALGDFKRIANNLQRLCHFEYFTAIFQGETSTASLSNAIELVAKQHSQAAFDAVVIIRGGGAQGDLHYLNEYELARKICTFPIPVLSGIGHDSDQTIIDEVAHIRFSTPTKTAMFIHNQILERGRNAIVFWAQIEKACVSTLNYRIQELKTVFQHALINSEVSLNNNKHRLTAINERYSLLINNSTSKAADRLEQQKNHLAHFHQIPIRNREKLITAQRFLVTIQNNLTAYNRLLTHVYNQLLLQVPQNYSRKRKELEQAISIVRQSHPQKILQKGFAIIRQKNKVIARATNLQADDSVDIEFYDDTKTISKKDV